MEKSSITTKYGTKIDTSGLTPEQIVRVRKISESRGAYGAKGTALANSLRSRNKSGGGGPGDVASIDTGIDERTGGIDPGVVFGNLPKIPGQEDVITEFGNARQAAFDYATQYNEQDKAAEGEQIKQELANKGIPIDYKDGSLYQRSLQNLDRKYTGLEDQARNQAYSQASQVVGTEVNAAATASDQFLKAVLGMSDADLKRYATNKDYQAKLKAIAAQKRASGGGGGGSDSGDIISGGPPPGFNIG